ncbi:Adenylate cyclase type 6, partial [Frankliniella fusca]
MPLWRRIEVSRPDVDPCGLEGRQPRDTPPWQAGSRGAAAAPAPGCRQRPRRPQQARAAPAAPGPPPPPGRRARDAPVTRGEASLEAAPCCAAGATTPRGGPSTGSGASACAGPRATLTTLRHHLRGPGRGGGGGGGGLELRESSALLRPHGHGPHPGEPAQGSSPASSSPSHSPSPASPQLPHQPTRKSNWEVIEHFNTSAGAAGAPPAAPGAMRARMLAGNRMLGNSTGSRNASIREEDEADDCWGGDGAGARLDAEAGVGDLDGGDASAATRSDGRVVCDAEAVYLMGAKPGKARAKPKRPLARLGWTLQRRCHRLCRTHRFRNLQVEMLYQRYFLRTNQSHMTHLLAVLVALCLLLALFHLGSVHYAGQPSSVPVLLTHASCVAVYVALMVLLARPAMNELYLLGVSYAVCGTFLVLELVFLVAEGREQEQHAEPSAAMAPTLFFIYVTYALLPLRLQEAVCAGVLLALAHLVTLTATTDQQHQDGDFVSK